MEPKINSKYNVAMAQKIELWNLDRLKPYDKNAREHSREQVAQIAASITEFGFLNPILVDSNDGIVAGHGRLSCSKRTSFRCCACCRFRPFNRKSKKGICFSR